MKNKKRKFPKVKWFDKTTLVFEGKQKLLVPWTDEVIESRKGLVIAQKGKDLFFLAKNGGRRSEEFLCFFCKFGISVPFVDSEDLPSCLLGKDCGWVKFCRTFELGDTFGVDEEADLGERLITAEKVLHKIIWKDCLFCEYWNRDDLVRFVRIGKDGLIGIVDDFFIGNLTIDEIPITKSGYCNLLFKRPEAGYCRICKDFRVTKDKGLQIYYNERKSYLKNYIAKQKSEEKIKKKCKNNGQSNKTS